MKTLIKIAAAAVMIAAGTALKAQDFPKEFLGLPGDNLNLYAVLNTFQESRNLKAFERSINDPDNRINNLDLNGDNLVDYIMVSEYVDGNVHYIVMRVAINRREKQDVAVFTIQRFNSGEVYVQLTGDELLYGKNYIIEPARQVLLADWPCVRNILRSNYTVWESDWGWGYYPEYWVPWTPVYWHYYYGYNYYWNDYYYTCYHRAYAHHDQYWNDHYYHGHRISSPAVTVNIYNGHYNTTYSRPEQRREGEEVYKRNNPDQGRRATYSTNTVTNTSAGRQEGSSVTRGRRAGSTGTEGITRAQRPATTSSNEIRTIGSSSRVERPVQSSVREERPVQSSVREERPYQSEVREERAVQPQAREQRPVNSSATEVRTISSSERTQRPVQATVREERPVQAAIREERPVQSSSSASQRSNDSDRQVKSNSGGERQVVNTNTTEKEKETGSAGTTRRK
jgi:hypothetical protein